MFNFRRVGSCMSKQNSKLTLSFLCLVFALTFAPTPLFAGNQRSSLSQAANMIKNAEYDIKSAKSSAGTAARPAKGSRLKLTMLRINSAKPRLESAGKILATIPTDNGEAAALRKRHQAAMAEIARIEAILSQGSTPKPKAAPKVGSPPKRKPSGTGAPKAKKLDYRQEKTLKDARWYLRETLKYNKPAADIVARLDGKGPQPVHSEVKNALQSIQLGIPKYNLAVKYIGQLDANHPQVAPIRAQIQDAGNQMGALQSRLKATSGKLQKLTGMENYPQYNKDYDLVRNLSRRYRDFNEISQNSKALAEVIKEDGAAVKEFQRIAKTYAPLVQQKTPAGQKMEKQVVYALNKRKKFGAELMNYKKKLPAAIDADIAEAERLSLEAVAKKKPMYFAPNSGIEQQLSFAESKLLVAQAFGQDQAAPMVKKMAAARSRIKERAKSLEAEIIATNPLPPNNFTGGDRNMLVELAKKAWTKEQSDAQYLGARIPSQAWQRTTQWRWSSGAFYKIDSSHVQVQLLVKYDDKLAVVRPINIYKNHMKNDSLSASPFQKFSEKLQPRSFLMLDKIR